MNHSSLIETWQRVSQWRDLQSLTVEQRISLHVQTFADWDVATDGPAPIWFPTEQDVAASNLHALMERTGQPDFESLRSWWQDSREEFWTVAASQISGLFAEPAQCTLDGDDPRNPNWFPGAKMSVVQACRGVIDGDQVAIKHAAADGEIHEISYDELFAQVRIFAARIRAAGFEPGDRLAIVMPMNAKSVVIYLGILYAGCAAVSIADSFAAGEIAKRLRISQAKAVFYSQAYQRAGKTIALGESVVGAEGICEKAGQVVRLFADDYSWLDVESLEAPFVGEADHIVNVLFSSGTTGDPKAIPWDQTTPIKCATDGKYHHDIKIGDVVVWPTNLGWMMGPWLIFATLINGGTIGLFEDAPTGEGFGEFVQDAKTTMLGVVPALVRHWKKTKCMEAFDWSSIRCFSSTGEASNEKDMTYLSALAGFRPIIEYCGGTEIGGGYASSTMIQPNVPAAFSTVAIGNQIVILSLIHI